MTRSELSRRHLLLAATASAAMLIGRAGTSRAQSAIDQAAPKRTKAAVPLIPRRLLFADADRSVVRISPDGTRLAFLAPLAGVLNLWIGPIGDVTKARPFTRVTDRNLGPWLVWLHDNRHVVFFREQIVAAMKQRGIPVTYVYYTDEGHGFRRPENRRSFTAVTEAFLAKHLGGRQEPVGDD